MGIDINKVILKKNARKANAAIGFISHAIKIPLSKYPPYCPSFLIIIDFFLFPKIISLYLE